MHVLDRVIQCKRGRRGGEGVYKSFWARALTKNQFYMRQFWKIRVEQLIALSLAIKMESLESLLIGRRVRFT